MSKYQTDERCRQDKREHHQNKQEKRVLYPKPCKKPRRIIRKIPKHKKQSRVEQKVRDTKLDAHNGKGYVEEEEKQRVCREAKSDFAIM